MTVTYRYMDDDTIEMSGIINRGIVGREFILGGSKSRHGIFCSEFS